MKRGATFLAVVVGLGGLAVRADEPALSLTDLAAYREALTKPAPGPAKSVTFRDLWSRPETLEGQRVRVEGRVARQFRQGAVGTFPGLVETWAVSPAGDPFCLVFPESKAQVRLGDVVRFDGTFLRRVRYRGSDADRLAPLIVGDRPPEVTSSKAQATGSRPFAGDRLWLDGSAAMAVGLVVVGALLRNHLRRPPRPSPGVEPPPEFLGPL